jgi:hypothetical protein
MHIDNSLDKNNTYSIAVDDLSMNDTFFFNKLTSQLQLQKNDSINTPLFLSQNNSDDEGEASPRSNFQIHNEILENSSRDYRQLSFQEVEKSIEKYYDYETKYSNEFDLLITYLNGQKHLFIQSKKITQTKLNILIVPSLIISAMITLFLPLSSENHYWFTTILVSILNAAITLLISLVNYYKLESSQEFFKYFANQYETLQTDLEYKNNRLLFMDKKKQKRYVLKEIEKLEKKMNEIKNSSLILVPEELNKLFPIIYHINIFSVIKRIENYRINLIYKFRDVKNEIRFILYSQHKGVDVVERSLFQKRLNLLIDTKEKLRKQIISYKNSYHDIDSLFNKEIKFAESYRTLSLFFVLPCCLHPSNLEQKCIMNDDDNNISSDILNQF